MKKCVITGLAICLCLALCAGTGMAAVYGGIAEREALSRQQASKENHGLRGDVGGVFTASLNATQPIYYTYDWSMNFFELVQGTSDPSLSAASGSPLSGTQTPQAPQTQEPSKPPEPDYTVDTASDWNPDGIEDELAFASWLEDYGNEPGYPPREGAYTVKDEATGATYSVLWNEEGYISEISVLG